MPQPARSRTKACERCQAVSSTLFRVVHEAPNKWMLICPACRAEVESQPLYRYGGTWKANKRH